MPVREPSAVDGARPASRPGPRRVWALVRLSLGWVFLWGFVDKTFGLGMSTAREDAWLNGGSPTFGFLSFGTSGPLAGRFESLAGSPLVDGLYMIGLLGLAVALLLGIGLRIAAAAGFTLMALIYAARLWPEQNPFMDQHVVYALVLVGLAMVRAGDTWGLGQWWSRRALVQRFPVLR